jgi:hypothetical protein
VYSLAHLRSLINSALASQDGYTAQSYDMNVLFNFTKAGEKIFSDVDSALMEKQSQFFLVADDGQLDSDLIIHGPIRSPHSCNRRG